MKISPYKRKQSAGSRPIDEHGDVSGYYATILLHHDQGTLNVSNGYFASTMNYHDDVARPISENVASCSHYLDNDLNYENYDSESFA